MYTVHLLPALFGDSILVEYGPKAAPRYILIDGGPYFAFPRLYPALKKVAPKLKELELLVITHIDIDHIDGTIVLLNQDKLPFKIKQVWFNGYKQIRSLKSDLLGALQGEYISKLIAKKKLPLNKAFNGAAVMVPDYNDLPEIKLPGGMVITLLSPGKEALVKLKARWDKEIKKVNKRSSVEERWKKAKGYRQRASDLLGTDIKKLQQTKKSPDKSVANQSSIAFIAACEGKTCLFAGDATSDSLLKAITPVLEKTGKRRLALTAWKLAHHGSGKSNQPELMQKIATGKLLVSSDGSRYKHPDPECIAQLIGYTGPGLTFYFNYRTGINKEWDQQRLQHINKYKAVYPPSNDFGITIKLA